MRRLLSLPALTLSAFLAVHAEAMADELKAVASYGHVRCGYVGSAGDLSLSMDVARGASVDEIALVKDGKWTFLTADRQRASKYIKISPRGNYSSVQISMKDILPIISQKSRVNRKIDFNFRIGKDLDSEDNVNIAMCRYLYTE